MSKFFSKLSTLIGEKRDAWKATVTRFPEIDVDQLAGDLGLKDKGKERSTLESVHLDGDGLDIVEREIVEEIRSRARLARNDYYSELELYESRLKDSVIDKSAYVQIKAAAEDGITNFKAQVQEDKVLLEKEKSDALEMARHFEEFKRRNCLENRSPIVLTDTERTMGLLWVTAIFLFESIMNGFFFAEGSEAGLVGGVMEALMLSFLNISLGAAMGFFATRYVNHVSLYWRLLAITSVLAISMAAGALNLLIAHYREAFALAAGNAVDFSSVVESFVSEPLVLSDAKSWILGLVGIVIWAFSSYKFYGLQDPYPGYSSLARRRNRALEGLSEARKAAIGILAEHKTAAIEEMNAIIAMLSSRRYEYEMAFNGRIKLYKQFKEYLEGLCSSANKLQQTYRAQFGGRHIGSGEIKALLSLESPEEVPGVMSNDETSHALAIDTMNDYIERISKEFIIAIDAIGSSAEFEGGERNASAKELLTEN